MPKSWNKVHAEITRADVERDGVLRQEGEVIAEVFVDRDGKAIEVMVMRTSLVHGVPLLVEVLDEPQVEAAAREAAELLGRHGLIGPCLVTGRQPADGPWQYYEINACFTGTCSTRAKFGFKRSKPPGATSSRARSAPVA